MIQLLGLRSFQSQEKDKKIITSDGKFFKENWRAESVPELFKNLEKYLEKIPAGERWNMFYTLANCTEKKRDFKSQGVIAFDIDGVAEDRRKEAALAAVGALGLAPHKTGMVSSGGGVHILVGLTSLITDRSFFKENKSSYNEACARISKAITTAGIEHKTVDTVVFEPRRILRLPGTENRKEGKPVRQCTILQGNIEPQDFDLSDFSPLGKTDIKDPALPARAMARYAVTDSEAVLKGCNFLGWAKDHAARANEPQWYAALSIVARLSPLKRDEKEVTGNELCHEISGGHPGYSPEETDRKIAQALDASGPRTCHGINALWGKCHECPNFEKVVSPIQLVSADRIKTELTGFHHISANGKVTPCLEDLREFFKREWKYRTLAGARIVYCWNGTHYEMWSNNEIEQFAHVHFNPKVKPSVMREFRELIGATEIQKPEWFGQSIEGHINFKNGILDMQSGKFFNHDPAYGFRYVLPYEYDPSALCPRFDAFLHLVTGGNENIKKIILEFMGYALSGDEYWNHKVLTLEGIGSNGKSTLINVIQELAGKGNYSTCSIKDLDDEYQRALFDGKLFNISEETPTKALMDTNNFKSMSSGAPVNARPPYKEPFTLINRAKFIMVCNELSKSADTSLGFFRRLLIVPFDQLITKETTPDFDPYIISKLKKELPGIFNLILEGYRRLKKQGDFTASETVAAKVAEYELTVNTVKSWYTEEVMTLSNGSATLFTPTQELFDAYRIWIKNREGYAVTHDKFSKEMHRIIPDKDRWTQKRHPETGRGAHLKRGVVGIGLRREHEELEAPGNEALRDYGF